MEFRSCINYLLTASQQRVSQHVVAALAEYDLTVGQYGIMNYLWEHGEGTPKELAAVLRLETSTISGLLDRLQKKSFIDRFVDPRDRRSVQVLPTEQGLSIRDAVVGRIDDLNAQMLTELSPEKRAILLDCLRAIGQVS